MPKKNGSTIERDLGYARIRTGVGKAKGLHVDVGIFGGKKPGGDSVLAYAMVHEFGSKPGSVPMIPMRSFIRSTADRNNKKYMALLSTAFQWMITGHDVVGLLTKLGLLIRNDTVQAITDLKDPPLADSTVKRKMRDPGGGGSNPLIHTGTMRRAVVFQVRRNGKSVT